MAGRCSYGERAQVIRLSPDRLDGVGLGLAGVCAVWAGVAAAAAGGNVFGELMETVKSTSLGRISRALYAVGGQYRRNM